MKVESALAEGVSEEPGLLRALWHFAWLVVTMTLLGGVNGYAVAVQQPVLFESSSTLLLADPLDTALSVGSPRQIGTDRYMSDQAHVVGSLPVLQRAAELSTVPIRPVELVGRVKAEPSKNVDVLRISVTYPTSEGASALVSAVVKAYEEVVDERFNRTTREAMAELEGLARQTRERLSAIQGVLATNPASALLAAEREAAVNQLSQVESVRQQLAVNAKVFGSGVEVLQPAAGAAQVQPAPLRGTAVGAFLGFFVAAAIAWSVSVRKAHEQERFERLLGVPLLGEIPKFSRSRGDGLLPAMNGNRSMLAAAYRYVLASLDLARDPTSRIILLTSIRAGEGKTITCANLAAAANEGGRRVLLVDADRRTQQLTRSSGAARKSGTSVDGNGLPIGIIARDWRPMDELDIPLVAFSDWNGDSSAGPLRSLAIKKVFRDARLSYDLILVDSPPLLSLGDAVEVLPYVDAIVLVVTPDTPEELYTAALQRLELMGLPLIGCVYNRTNPRKSWYRSALPTLHRSGWGMTPKAGRPPHMVRSQEA